MGCFFTCAISQKIKNAPCGAIYPALMRVIVTHIEGEQTV